MTTRRKISLINSVIIPFDLYVVAGFDVVVAGKDMAVRPGFNVGLGQRFMLGEWLALRIQDRDQVYVDKQTVNNQERSDIQNYVMLEAGVSFYLPPRFEYSGL